MATMTDIHVRVCMNRALALRESPHQLISYINNNVGCDVLSRSRIRKNVQGRQLFCYILRKSGLSLPQIGRLLGGYNHSTVISLLRSHDANMKYDGDVVNAYPAEDYRLLCAKIEDLFF